MSAFASVSGGIVRWTEQGTDKAEWFHPDFFPVPDLTDVVFAQGADGYVHVVGRRSSTREEGAAVSFVHAAQYQTGRPIGSWRSLGNLYKNEDMSRQVGTPTAAVDKDGGLHVFVRNFGKGVHGRRQSSEGSWTKWADMKGSGVLDGLLAFATRDGLVSLVAPAEKRLSLWAQSKAGGPVEHAGDLPVLAQQGSCCAIETAPGRVTYLWHAADGTGVQAYREGAGLMSLGGGPASDALAATRAVIDGYDCTVLAYRSLTGGTALAAYPTENEAAGLWWTETGEDCLGSPALATDAQGRIVIAAISRSGELLVTRQKDNRGLSLGKWMRF
ncbi:hypothetical protein [Streptomyces nitrosporeus]|uniref:Exo-alpha-sialidase n=1 Tax=Streptomyces nitrosporeus TaxID=28894 RepID=A0A5J6F991_9ACTN|nr:hypothetical protein [Streptomyces nitrosporeus]QEU71555.1 hypothetical protein CP967_05885 [Streptomyces nitrosporeus]GGZ11336.1 hypothetical protein GCM10010327_47610 [Streptomyces nitrosporeus]